MHLKPLQRRAYSYRVTTPPAGLPVSLADFKSHLKITHNLEDSLLTIYLTAATEFAENYTKRDLITRTYTTYRDFFPCPAQNEGYYSFGSVPRGTSQNSLGIDCNVGFEIRKSPLQQVNSIEYTDTSGSNIVVASTVYYNSVEEDYSEVLLSAGQDWPTDAANQMQAIRISFDTGFGDTEADIPDCWKVAIMNHATAFRANRGDCAAVCNNQGSNSAISSLPTTSKFFYDQKRIINI